ncbi:DEAD/DEAH box helicase family protein [Sulfurihydrogenibium subterraneum]|uniref:DEAD/DEAH box helicase family protein n=1 Tax=Sulfurihydrogenibium subterraneum TaxID=171121 RepID=UPI00048EA2DD|nr:DEAD/DEAH box helicase family protein [Sulfurihydrogenibium subterraneum]
MSIETYLPSYMSKYEIKEILEKLFSNQQILDALLKGKDICAKKPEEINKISPLHKYTFLYFLFEEIIGFKQKELYKRSDKYDLLTQEDIKMYLTQKPIFERKKDKIEEAISNTLNYEKEIRKNIDGFIFTYYQFFTVLFTELFFLFRENIESELKKYIEKNYSKAKEILAIKRDELELIKNTKKDKTKLEKSVEYFENYVNQPLNKLAYYMATGSGKTHILHINILQTKKYLRTEKKYFLIVPNNELALQHKKNLEKFGINNIGYIEDNRDTKLFKEVEKLILEYESNNYDLVILTVHQLRSFMSRYKDKDIGDFGDNILFVDEGHKGGESGWREDRNKLAGNNGFVFEYSATFAQAIKSNEKLLREYSKSIIYFYPYHKFHDDGYGKTPEFYPKEETSKVLSIMTENKSKTKIKEITVDKFKLFVQNLLSHYNQVKYYLKNKDDKEFSEKFKLPLNMFVVYRVGSNKNEDVSSHIYELYKLFQRFLKNENNETLNLILKYREDFNLDLPERDIFDEIITYCLYGDKNDDNQSIRVWEFSNNELSFSLGEPDKSFAVVYVGNVASISEFEKIKVKSHLYNSIIDNFLSDPDNSNIQFLIVGRKLLEGFDTIRINTLSLFEIGKSEGSLVVQLFGRGVRLKGSKEDPLKRENKHPVMEKLNIFGYNAEYLRDFIENVELYDVINEVEYVVKINFEDDSNGNPLYKDKKIPHIEKSFEESDEYFLLYKDEKIKSKIKKKISNYLEEYEDGLELQKLIQFKYIFNRVLEEVKYSHVLITYKDLEDIFNFLFDKKYKFKAYFKNLDALNEFIILMLKNYIYLLYNQKRKEYETEHITLKSLDETHKNLNFSYKIRVPENSEINKVLKNISKNGEINLSLNQSTFDNYCFETMYLENKDLNKKELFAIKVDRHIYYPLLCKINDDNILISPDRLEESEIKFVDKFCSFIKKENSLKENLTLLRNLKSGVGFSGFYPDFILWYLEEKENETIEHIIFIDPKGMTAHNVREVLEKSKLSLRLKELELKLREKDEFKNVRLHSFILLNQPLEEYLKIEEMKDSINNFFTEEIIGDTRKINIEELKDLMRLYNIFYLEEENVINGILNKLSTNLIDEYENIKKIFIEKYKKDEKLKQFFTEWQEIKTEKNLKNIKEKYGLCTQVIKKEEALIAFLLKILISDKDYEEYCKKLGEFSINFKELKDELKEQGMEILIEKFFDNLFSEILNGVPLAGKIYKATKEFLKRKGYNIP